MWPFARRATTTAIRAFIFSLLSVNKFSLGCLFAHEVELNEQFVDGGAIGWTRVGRRRTPALQNIRQRLPRPCDTTLGCPYGAARARCCLLIGKPPYPDQHQGFALRVRQGFHRTGRIGKFNSPMLFVERRRNSFSRFRIPRGLPPRAALVGKEFIAEDRKHPSLEIASRRKRAARPPY